MGRIHQQTNCRFKVLQLETDSQTLLQLPRSTEPLRLTWDSLTMKRE